jgi:hypothetical protein
VPFPLRFVAFARRYLAASPSIRSQRWRARGQRWAWRVGWVPSPWSREETRGSPRFLGDPHPRAPLSDPGAASRQQALRQEV